MKRYFTLIFVLSFISQLNVNAQWTFNTTGNQYVSSNGLRANTAGTMSVTSTGGGVHSSVNPEGMNLTNTLMLLPWENNTYNLAALNTATTTVLNSVPLDKWYKAKTGKSETIQLNYSYRTTTPAVDPANPIQTNSFSTNFKVVVGSQESHSTYQNFTSVPTLINETFDGNMVSVTIQAVVNFPVGSTKGYVVIPVFESFTNIGRQCYRDSPPTCFWVDGGTENIIILPFIVEGASIDLTQPDAVGIAGYTKEPAIPYMILHAPPGDQSFVTFEQAQETCRSFSESMQDDFSLSGKLDVTLGIAGSAGLFVTTNFEFSATISVTGGGGNTLIKKANDKTCISAVSSINTLTKASGVEDGTIYMGYSSDLAYGFFPRVIIESNNPLVVKKDTALIFGTVGSPLPFYMSKNQIIADIAVKQAIVDAYVPSNPTNEQALSLANHSLNQIKVWRQVLAKDSANMVNTQNDVINESYTIASDRTITEAISYARSTEYDVNRYISFGAGASFVVKVAGSGISGGAEFSTKKSFGQGVANSSNSTSSIKYRLFDDDYRASSGPDEIVKMKIVRDPDYGTPIFLLDSANSRTSAPYEGGYQRDQPSIEFSFAPTSSRYTIPNVPVGATAEFGVKICNKSNEPRTYYFGFDPVTNQNSTSITFSAPPQGAKYGPFNVPANSCNSGTYFGTITQTILGALTSKEIKLQLYPDLEPNISSDLFVTANWGNYALPSNLTSSNNVVCPGSDVTLSAFCPAGVVTWYNSAIAETPLATGSSITQTPTANTDYFVSCQAGIYNYQRVKASSVSVPSFVFPTLNLTADIRANTLQLANTNFLASNKIFSPANVSYLAGNSLTFEPGFEVSSGGIFEAKIGGCANLVINGLVAYYPFNGNANDESANNNNGIVNGATLTTDRFGNPDKAYAFDGVDDRINANVGAEMYSAEKTISVWAMVSGAGSVNPRLVGVGPHGASQQHYAMLLEGETSPRRLWFFTSYIVTNAFSTALIPNSAQWNHYTITIKENIAKIYINGTLDSETTLTGALTSFTSALLQIGYSDNGLDWFNGKLDDIRIYNRGLSDAEVQAIYNAEKP